MPGNPSSLIERDAQQLELISTADMSAAVFLPDETGPVKDYTAERLWRQRPDIYRAIVSMSAEGIGVHRIAAHLQIGGHTVRAVRARERVATAHARERLAGNMAEAAAALVEVVLERTDDPAQRAKLPMKDAGFVASQLSERSDALRGHATQIIGVVVVDPGREELARLLTAGKMDSGARPGETMRAEVAPGPAQLPGDPARLAPAMDAEYADTSPTQPAPDMPPADALDAGASGET